MLHVHLQTLSPPPSCPLSKSAFTRCGKDQCDHAGIDDFSNSLVAGKPIAALLLVVRQLLAIVPADSPKQVTFWGWQGS